MGDIEQRWAERDRRRAEDEQAMAQRRKADRDHHVAIVEEALRGHATDQLARLSAEVAVDALLAAGVVFAYMSDCDPSGSPAETGEDDTDG